MAVTNDPNTSVALTQYRFTSYLRPSLVQGGVLSSAGSFQVPVSFLQVAPSHCSETPRWWDSCGCQAWKLFWALPRTFHGRSPVAGPHPLQGRPGKVLYCVPRERRQAAASVTLGQSTVWAIRKAPWERDTGCGPGRMVGFSPRGGGVWSPGVLRAHGPAPGPPLRPLCTAQAHGDRADPPADRTERCRWGRRRRVAYPKDPGLPDLCRGAQISSLLTRTRHGVS